MVPTDITVKMILSIDRRNSLEDALDTVALAAEYKDRGVVGVDFSGNPSVCVVVEFLHTSICSSNI